MDMDNIKLILAPDQREERVIITADGFKVGSYQSDGYYRKDRIIRNRALPKWVIQALKEGKYVVVTDFVRKDDYIEVKGRAVAPTKKERQVEGIRNRGYLEEQKGWCVWNEAHTYEDLFVDGVCVHEGVYPNKIHRKNIRCDVKIEDLEAYGPMDSFKEVTRNRTESETKEDMSRTDYRLRYKDSSIFVEKIEQRWTRVHIKRSWMLTSAHYNPQLKKYEVWDRLVEQNGDHDCDREYIHSRVDVEVRLEGEPYETKSYSSPYESNDGMRMERTVYFETRQWASAKLPNGETIRESVLLSYKAY